MKEFEKYENFVLELLVFFLFSEFLKRILILKLNKYFL